MSFLHNVWSGLQSAFHSSKRPAPVRRRATRFRPHLELLEGRELPATLSALASLASHHVHASAVSAPAHASSTAPVLHAASAPAVRAATTPSQMAPVLMVIGNQGFNYQEFNDTRTGLLNAGFNVVVAAGTLAPCQYSYWNGHSTVTGTIMPDVAVTNISAADYTSVVFVGGYGASQYQYAFPGTYTNNAFNGTTAIRQAVNNLITDFVHQGKYITAICHGVSVLAWARVDGQSPLQGETVTAYDGNAPTYTLNGVTYNHQPDSWNSTTNGATVLAPGSIGNPHTAADDVVVDGNIITAQNPSSALYFGQVLAQQLLIPPSN